MSKDATVILRNVSHRPVELHFPGRVLVLAPREMLELSQPNPVCEALERRGVLTRHVRSTPDALAARGPGIAPVTGAEAKPRSKADTRRTRPSSSRTPTRVRHVKGDSE